MIRHIVLIKFNPSLSGDDIADIFAELRAIKDKLPGVLAPPSARRTC